MGHSGPKMSKLIIVVFSLLGLSACVGQAAIVQIGQCDETVGVVTNLVAADFAGVWYDIESLPSTFQTGTCNTATYSVNNDGSLSIQNTQIVNGVLQYVTGTATATPGVPAGTAKFQVSISGAPAVPYWVLATDYNTYALIYSCRNINANQREVNSWKLGRNKGALPLVAATTINGIITSVAALNAVSNQYIQRTHTLEACSYFVEFDGQCPTTVNGIANFDVNRYLGTWYEVARYPQTAQTGQCNRAQYTAGTAGEVSVVNSQVTNEVLGTMTGTATAVAGQSGVLQVTFTVAGEVRNQNLYVLATDYENYALVYSCANVGVNRRRIGSWQLSRNTNPLAPAAVNAINAAITATPDLHAAYYQETSQTDAACYYSEFAQPPSSIVLPGLCDTSITGVANFDVARYLGTWYEVSRYPQPTQTGQCNRALYETGAATNVVSILNSQVIAEALGTISGTATAVPGQSGVLQVTFTVAGEIRNSLLYVLATDYDNYALVYSCANLPGNTGRRQVSSWKLSRTPNPLSAEANNAINPIITATEGLRQDFYQETSQTDAACFYYPEFEQPPPTIVLPGLCDTSITGVANFDVNRYLGTWYEVARYPQTAQTGQCNRAQYTAGTAGEVSVVNSQVTTEVLGTMTGTATVVPGQSGVLQVTFTVNNEVRNQNLYVLATDYDNYALVYSCENIATNNNVPNSRRVGSWKLSRTPNPLSAAVNNVINPIIAATQGLRQDYYQETSQTAAACFYYPVYEPLPPTIQLPGLCDTSITGVANFDVTRYLGRWYEVARYPQTAQTGQCNRAQYTAGTAGEVSVVNSQVTNEVLGTMTGTATAVAGQSGVLQVTFTVAGEVRNQNLYVLATDYDNYALVYSCENIATNNNVPNSRRVGSWKLSRTPNPLSAAANNAINPIIAATQGLNQNYYQETNQTDAACWHYLPQLGDKVIIPGQCDTSIAGVANINLPVFANGIWYQVQRYDLVGTRTCIGSKLSYDDGYINVNSIEVIGEEVKRTEGIARLTTANTGKFTLEMADSEEQQEIYILATDNSGYAIAYSCKNSGPDNRQIGAWQLSRGKTMPAAGVAALNRLINDRREFTNQPTYFKEITHPENCPEPSSAFLFKSSIIVIFVCTILQLVW